MPIKMKELPLSERPYEKLEMYGEASLSNSELLAIILKTGTREETAVTLAQKILKLKSKNESEQIRSLQEISLAELQKIKGIGKVKAIEIRAVCELAKRMARPINTQKVQIKTGQDVANLFLAELQYEKTEHLKVVLLNSKNRVQKIVEIAHGGNNAASIEPKEILLEAIKIGCNRIILVHNHPSGDPTPSRSDYLVNDRIYEAADILGIQLLDHIIIGDGKYQSMMYQKQDRKIQAKGRKENHETF